MNKCNCAYIENRGMREFIKSMDLQKEYDLFMSAMREEFIKECKEHLNGLKQ